MPHVDLFLWRHAEAEEALPDLGRALTAKGRRDAARVGRALAKLLAPDARIVASPALRTRETADALTGRAAWPIEFDPRIAPGAAFSDVVATLDEALAAAATANPAILLVGHQPWLGQLARHLLTGHDGEWAFRKAAAWWLVRRGHDAAHAWTLKSVLDPDVV